MSVDVEASFQGVLARRWETSRSSADERRARLQRLRAAIVRHADDAADALFTDLGKPREQL